MQIINYTIEKNGLSFSDAIILEDDVIISEIELETLKQIRFDNWYTVITTPYIEPPIDESIINEALNNGS